MYYPLEVSSSHSHTCSSHILALWNHHITWHMMGNWIINWDPSLTSIKPVILKYYPWCVGYYSPLLSLTMMIHKSCCAGLFYQYYMYSYDYIQYVAAFTSNSELLSAICACHWIIHSLWWWNISYTRVHLGVGGIPPSWYTVFHKCLVCT